jgi:hypothetical protein
MLNSVFEIYFLIIIFQIKEGYYYSNIFFYLLGFNLLNIICFFHNEIKIKNLNQ